MLIEFCTMLGACMLGAMILGLVLQCYISITNKIRQKKQIIILDKGDKITYKGIEYEIVSKKVKVRRIIWEEGKIKEKDKYNDYY